MNVSYWIYPAVVCISPSIGTSLSAGLTPLEGVLAAAAECADIAEVRTIAFPQEGCVGAANARSEEAPAAVA